MPPRNIRISTKRENSVDSAEPSPKRAKKRAQLTDEPVPTIDTYRPAVLKEENEKRVKDLIHKLYPKSRKKDPKTQQLRLLVSNTEGDLLLGRDGKTHIQSIQKDSGSILVVTEKVEGSVDREVLMTGGVKEIARACALVAYFLTSVLENSTIDSLYHLTLLFPGHELKGVQMAQPSVTVDISSEFIPFSNFRSVYIDGKLPVLMSVVVSLLEQIEKTFKKEVVPAKVPVIGTFSGEFIRSETNQKLLDQSKELYTKFINREYAQLKSKEEDPKQHSISVIEEATKECQKKIKVLEPLKQVIDIPLDFISAVIGRGGSKINEIRARSNSNVVVGDSIKDAKYRTITLTGLPEGNLTALRYLQGIIQ
jgi:hypothetical protein